MNIKGVGELMGWIERESHDIIKCVQRKKEVGHRTNWTHLRTPSKRRFHPKGEVE